MERTGCSWVLFLPLVLAFPHPAATHAAPDSITYRKGGKCLSLGAPIPTSEHPSWEMVASNCDNATSWTESMNEHGHPYPQVSTSVASRQQTCISIDDPNGMCNRTFKVVTGVCNGDIKAHVLASFYFWDNSAKLLRSQFCLGMCVDLDGETAVLKSCAGVKGWSRQGSSDINWFMPKPLPDGRKTGRYHMTWPMTTFNGVAVVGIDTDGYPGYFGSNNAEVCPEGQRYSVVDGKGVTDDCKHTGCKCYWPKQSDIPLWHGGEHTGKTPGNVDHPIKRSEIVQRAIVQVAHGFGRDGDDFKDNTRGLEGCSSGDPASTCPSYFHGGACCSMPTQAWNVSSGSCLRNAHQSIRVDCLTEMKPGDAVSLQKQGKDDGHNFPAAKHIVLFRKWTDEKKKSMLVFEDKGRHSYSSYGYDAKHMYCMKRRNTIEDVE